MLENYKLDEFGIIHQINKSPFEYNSTYINKGYLNRVSSLTIDELSFLRLGYICNSVPVCTSLLDVGFGTGAFLKAASSYAKNTAGYDVFYNENLPETAYRETNILSNFYDVITFFDSLEHFDSIDFVKDLKCQYVVISVPWCHYYDFSDDIWFEGWKHRKPDEHLHHFNHLSLTKFMKHNGYKRITYSYMEDIIRKPVDDNPNILTAIFVKE